MIEEGQSDSQEIRGHIKGELLYTIYENESENFTIAKIKVLETTEKLEEKEIVAKGYFCKLQDGGVYTFYGKLERHAKFGMQYSIDSYQTFMPDSKEGVIAYLSSALFYGIGKKIATQIVEHLGESAIAQILQNNDVLDTVPGLKKETATTLLNTLKENQGFEHIVVYLAKYNIGLKMAQKIYEQYKDDAIEKLQTDPYQFVFDIDGFGFQTADSIARLNGLSDAHPNRIGAGCIYVLNKSTFEGHVYLPIMKCVDNMLELLATPELTTEVILDQLEEMDGKKTVIMHEGNVYLPTLYYAEDGFASQLQRIIEKPIEVETTTADLMKIIGHIEEAEVLSYGKEQFSAINQALHSKLMILTGGPGTGKTTVVKGIIGAYAEIHDVSMDPADYEDKAEYPFVLTAPTGRAAKRLMESTGIPAVTIHRLLGWNGKEGFDKNQQEQLNGKMIIIDEFSMVDIWLAHHLFKAIPNDMQVLLVGDEDQLPSVGPGQVLADLLASKVIQSVSLNEVYRQKEGSKIIQLAHEIKNDICTRASLHNDQDFSFISCNETYLIDAILQIFEKAMSKGIDVKDIQVLAPMYRSQSGITAINQQLQQLINPKSDQRREVKYMDTVFRVGDKVIQLVNQPDQGVYNGDIGVVVAVFEENENLENVEQLVIVFDEKEVVFERKDYTNIMHAYCISIHKSQGSEFPIVIMPVTRSYRRMLRKNLLYTAITRSKKSLIICGEADAFIQGIQTMDTNKRFTTLKEQIIKRMQEEVQIFTETDDDNISPYDFM